MATGSVQNFLMWALNLTKDITTSTFQNHRPENELLQKLEDEMFIIVLNTVQSKISPFIKSIWKDQYQQESVATTA